MTLDLGSSFPGRASGILLIAGTLFLSVGIAAWVAVSKQLRDERIVVPENAPVLAGRRVQDPLTAYVQALVIKGNAERGAGGRTFSDISEALRVVDKNSDQSRELRKQSSSLATAASLRTALMTSVLAFGVSTLVGGLGILLTCVGLLLRESDRS